MNDDISGLRHMDKLPVLNELGDLAPGVTFDEAVHKYWLRGKELSGVTRPIGAKLGTKMPEAFVGEARTEGLHVHHAIQEWINGGCTKINSAHPGALWLTETFLKKADPLAAYSEVLVSDLKQYASSVDIVAIVGDGLLDLYDMKRVFKRTSVSLQLSVYKYLIETFTPWKVRNLWCASYHDKEYYPIIDKGASAVEELLYGGKK